jgi:hypothetical protein
LIPARAVRSLVLPCLALLACGPAPDKPAEPPPPPVPSTAPAPLPPPPLSAAAWGTFRSERFELELPLPDGRAWRIDDHGGPWLSATHATSESTLLARSWTEDGRVTHQRCEERARLWLTLPDPARAEAVNARSIDAPAGFDTFVSVGLVTGKQDAPVSGFAVAFGGHGHRCFAWIYTTRASGPGAGPLLGERLATMVERSLGKAVIASELLPRIPRETPGGP